MLTNNLVNNLRYGYIREGFSNRGALTGDYVDFANINPLTAITPLGHAELCPGDGEGCLGRKARVFTALEGAAKSRTLSRPSTRQVLGAVADD
jgi:hypothetical protein